VHPSTYHLQKTCRKVGPSERGEKRFLPRPIASIYTGISSPYRRHHRGRKKETDKQSANKTGWTCHLQLEASTPFAATGLHSGVSVIPIRQSGFDSSTPSLGRLGGPKDPCPVYSISAFLPGSSPDIITTGWYDGKVRVHDLRLASLPTTITTISFTLIWCTASQTSPDLIRLVFYRLQALPAFLIL